MKLINFYMENWTGEDYLPLPNGVFNYKIPADRTVTNNYIGILDILRDSEIQSSYNEIFLRSHWGTKKFAKVFEHKDLKIVFSDQPKLE